MWISVRLAVNKAVQQVSVQRANMINALKREIEELQSKIRELIQGDIGSNITRIATRMQNQHVNFPDGTTHIVNAGIENIGSVCYLNAYLQVIASCPILQTACQTCQLYHPGSFLGTVFWQLLLVHWSVKTK